MSNPKFGTLEYEFEEAALLFSCSYGDGNNSLNCRIIILAS